MPALTFPDPGTPYTIDPWTDPNGSEWLYSSTKDRWSPVATGGGGEGGVSTFAALTDKASADIPTINTPLATALNGKLSVATAASTYATAAALTSGLATKQAAGSYPTGGGTSTGTNTGDETTATIKAKLSITTLSGTNTGDQDLSSYATTTALGLKANSASPTFTGTVNMAAMYATDVSAANVTVSTAFNGPGTGLTGTAASLSIGGSAATLTTARTINGVSFNGSANIGQDLQTTASPAFGGLGLNFPANSSGRRAWMFEGDSSQSVKFRRWSDGFGAATAAVFTVNNGITTDTFVINASTFQMEAGVAVWGSDIYLKRTGASALRLSSDGGTGAASLDIRGALTVNGSSTLTGNIILPTSTTPASATAAGVAGTICRDASYIYVCTATNTWTRVAIATW